MIESELGLDASYIALTGRMASHLYKTYRIAKRSGGTRVIDHPSRELKAMQRWLLTRVIEPLNVHACATGYRKGKGILATAAMHRRSRFLLRLDLADFFHSITARDIESHLTAQRAVLPPAWSPEDSRLFIQLVCKNDRLTIGAVTSPALSNTVCLELDHRVSNLCGTLDITYTRYADDLFFSTSRPDVLGPVPSHIERILGSLPYPSSLRVNHSKTFHSSKKARRSVTGLVLTSEGGVSIGRKLKRHLRSMIHSLNQLNAAERKWLAGYLAHCRSVEPEFLNRLIMKYGPQRIEEARRML
jgi:RNA-directed DNA polymerase